MIPALLSIIIAFAIFGTAVAEVTLSNLFVVNNAAKSERAFDIAESGLDYYLWHLNHNSTDYKDGQATPATPNPQLGYGPYVHNYVDTNGVTEGTYTLWINPPVNGSTIVTVRSIGQANGSGITRTVQAQIGSPSFASYGVVSDGPLWFGNDETADGPVESNTGIRMDGPNTSTVSSANSTYVPSFSVGGDGDTHNGVWCNASVTSPVNCNTRSKSDWIYPVSSVDFNQVTGALCTMKKVAFSSDPSTAALANQANACTQTPNNLTAAYVPQLSGSYSITKGYLIKLNSNGTYDLLKVTAENDRATPYTNALTTSTVATGISVPAAGVVFVEDNVWVLSNPNFHGRITIASGRLASSNNTNIVVAGNLLYSTKNGSDVIGLVAENSVYIAPYAPPASGAFNYEVDAAMLAENGNTMYGENGDNAYNPTSYRTNQNACTRGWTNSNQRFTFYGSVAVRQVWTWNWLVGGSCGDAAYDPINGYISGIENTTTSYDYNLEYAPPPSYPLTTGYNILSWREVLTHP